MENPIDTTPFEQCHKDFEDLEVFLRCWTLLVKYRHEELQKEKPIPSHLLEYWNYQDRDNLQPVLDACVSVSDILKLGRASFFITLKPKFLAWDYYSKLIPEM